MIIRNGSHEEIAHFALYDESNAGDEIEVVEVDGKVVAFIQHDGAYIYFLESNARGAGTALVDALKAEYKWLQACNVSRQSAGYWQHIGFEQAAATGERPGEYHYEWYAEEE